MEIEQRTEQEIVALRNRKKQILAVVKLFFSLVWVILLCLFLVSITKFNELKIICAIVGGIFLLEIVLILWLTRQSLRLVFSDAPILRINQEGIHFFDQVRFYRIKPAFIPWSEVAQLSCLHSQNLLLTITLKDPYHWWSLYGDGRKRKFRSNPHFAGAQFAFSQHFTTTPLLLLFQQIQENYAHEIQVNEVKLVPFASRFTNS